MTITSINLSSLAFLGSCDSTRAQMAAKQMSQSLTHLNSEIPYVISSDYYHLSDNSHLGICIAKDDGKVVFRNDEIAILYYKNLDNIEIKQIPETIRTAGMFASSLRHCLNTGDEFEKDDIIFEYDGFNYGIPSFGANIFTGYFTGFGYNHEDGLLVSESFAEKMKHKYVERIQIPIFEYSMFQPIYHSNENSLTYFPGIGQKIQDDVVCTKISPKTNNVIYNSTDLKSKMVFLLKSLNISELLSIESGRLTNFSVDTIKSKIHNGVVSGFKIHKFKKDVNLVNPHLQEVIEKMYKVYIDKYVIDIYNKLDEHFVPDFSKYVLTKNFVCKDLGVSSNRKDLKDCVYLIELEITKEDQSRIGDKFCNRYAGKGIVSHIIPDELRPIAVESNKPIDFIFNVFGVYSRMNLSQVIEGIVAKNVMYYDDKIKSEQDPCNIPNYVKELNNNVLRYLGNDKYSKNVDSLAEELRKNPKMLKKFKQQVDDSNIFIEGPPFSEINTKKVFQNSSVPILENVFMSKNYLKYMEQNLKIKVDYELSDRVVKNMFCVPIYIMKLCKLVSHLVTARDLGPCKYITKQPLKGRANKGGGRLGQMEIEGILAHGCERSLRELLSVKSDYQDAKSDLIRQLISTGEYHIPENEFQECGGTKKVVEKLIQFMRM